MKSSMFKVAFSISVVGINNASYASDASAKEYHFSDFDNNVFKNHVTRNVELFYPTPFVESVPHDPITIDKSDLRMLVYPALTRIVYKRRDMTLRHCNNPDGFAETQEQKEQVKKYWEKEGNHSLQLQRIFARAKGLEALAESEALQVTITANDLMFLIQFAARKTELDGISPAVVTDSEGRFKCFSYDDATNELLKKYRGYQNSY